MDRQVTISDDGPAIEQAVREGLSRADLVITTGGLGPTADDITRDHIAALLGDCELLRWRLAMPGGCGYDVGRHVVADRTAIQVAEDTHGIDSEGAMLLRLAAVWRCNPWTGVHLDTASLWPARCHDQFVRTMWVMSEAFPDSVRRIQSLMMNIMQFIISRDS
mgnify:CR=1 FL=1